MLVPAATVTVSVEDNDKIVASENTWVLRSPLVSRCQHWNHTVVEIVTDKDIGSIRRARSVHVVVWTCCVVAGTRRTAFTPQLEIEGCLHAVNSNSSAR